MYKIIGANQAEYGPVSADQIRQWITEGRVNAQTSAQAEGETGWKPISAFPEFAASFPSASVPPAFSPPPLGTTVTPEASVSRARSEVLGPAIALIVVGVLDIVRGGLAALANVLGISLNSFKAFDSFNLPGQNEQVTRMFQTSGGIMVIFLSILTMAIGAFILYGGLKMKDLQMHSLCIAASVVSIIPCISPCCCLGCVGIPIGIWALVILNKPDVRACFT